MLIMIHRNKRTPVKSLAEAAAIYSAARDKAGLGASKWMDATVTDDTGKPVARISYNGRIWPPEPWFPGMAPLAERVQRT